MKRWLNSTVAYSSVSMMCSVTNLCAKEDETILHLGQKHDGVTVLSMYQLVHVSKCIQLLAFVNKVASIRQQIYRLWCWKAFIWRCLHLLARTALVLDLGFLTPNGSWILSNCRVRFVLQVFVHIWFSQSTLTDEHLKNLPFFSSKLPVAISL